MKDWFAEKTGCRVGYADAHTDRDGEGVVDFDSKSDAIRALKECDGKTMNGKEIELSADFDEKDSRSRSRSRSRRRSRSRSDRKSRSRSASRGRGRSRSRSYSR